MVIGGLAGAVLVIAGIGIITTIRSRDGSGASATQAAAPTQRSGGHGAGEYYTGDHAGRWWNDSADDAVRTRPAGEPTPRSAGQHRRRGEIGRENHPEAERQSRRAAPVAQHAGVVPLSFATSVGARGAPPRGGSGCDRGSTRAGDDHNFAATAALQQGKLGEAESQLNLASTAWSVAERDARAAAAAAAAATAAKTKAAVAEPKQEVPTPTPQPTAAQTPPVAPKTPPNPAADIAAVVAAYERAIESRDIAEVRRAYPGVTPTQASGWEQFFRTVRSLRAARSGGWKPTAPRFGCGWMC